MKQLYKAWLTYELNGKTYDSCVDAWYYCGTLNEYTESLTEESIQNNECACIYAYQTLFRKRWKYRLANSFAYTSKFKSASRTFRLKIIDPSTVSMSDLYDKLSVSDFIAWYMDNVKKERN